MLKDGKLSHTVFEPGTKAALTWLNKAFTEKLIPADLAILKTTQTEDMITQSKAGIISAAINTRWKYMEPLRKAVPNADMLPLIALDGGKGLYAPKDSGFNGMFVIPKKVPEDKVKKILAMLDYGVSEEGHVIANYGIKDVHYTIKDGEIVSNSEAQQKDIVGQGVFGQIFAKYDKYLRSYFAGSPLDVINDNKKVIDERGKFGVADVASGLYSETYNKVGKDYDKKIDDMKIKVIMGKETLAAWDDFAAKLKSDAEFQKIIAETNKAYEKRNAK
jgi:putative aldouronate transport system substrate-binding protein